MAVKRKLITREDIRGINYTDDIEFLLDDINRKGDISGWYFSSWWFDIRHSKETSAAMDAIIWQLLVNNADRFGIRFNDGSQAQLRLKETASFIGEKLNGVWSGIIIKWLRSMKYDGYGIDVCDACGLDSLYLTLK